MPAYLPSTILIQASLEKKISQPAIEPKTYESNNFFIGCRPNLETKTWEF